MFSIEYPNGHFFDSVRLCSDTHASETTALSDIFIRSIADTTLWGVADQIR